MTAAALSLRDLHKSFGIGETDGSYTLMATDLGG